MTDLWVARDADGTLHEFYDKPKKCGSVWINPMYAAGFYRLNKEHYPDLQPGECRRLVLAEEKSE